MFTKGAISGFKCIDLKSKLFKKPKIEGVIEKEGEEVFSIPIETVCGDEDADDVPSELIPISPFFVIVGLVVIFGEKC